MSASLLVGRLGAFLTAKGLAKFKLPERIEAIDAFRREFPQTKIVVVSGGAQFTKRDYLPDAALIGVDATLQKPFEIDALLAVLKSL